MQSFCRVPALLPQVSKIQNFCKDLALLCIIVGLVFMAGLASAQSTAGTEAAAGLSPSLQSIPRLIKFNGIGKDANGGLVSGSSLVTFAIYHSAGDEIALWS